MPFWVVKCLIDAVLPLADVAEATALRGGNKSAASFAKLALFYADLAASELWIRIARVSGLGNLQESDMCRIHWESGESWEEKARVQAKVLEGMAEAIDKFAEWDSDGAQRCLLKAVPLSEQAPEGWFEELFASEHKNRRSLKRLRIRLITRPLAKLFGLDKDPGTIRIKKLTATMHEATKNVCKARESPEWKRDDEIDAFFDQALLFKAASKNGDEDRMQELEAGILKAQKAGVDRMLASLSLLRTTNEVLRACLARIDGRITTRER